MLIAATSALVLLCAPYASADVIVAPNALANVEGNDDNFGPFFNDSVRYQQIYSASQFPSNAGPLMITQIAFRPDGSVTNANFFLRFDSVRMDLSTTSRTPGTLSTVFADNLGPDVTTVFDSFVFTITPVTGPAGGPKDFSIAFNIVPFTYNPNGGDLLLDVRAFESGGGVSAPFDAAAGNPFTAHVDAASIGATSGDILGNGLVTQFQFTPVPEPSTLMLFSAGALLVGLGALRRRRRLSIPAVPRGPI
jgi:hypothetical protein